MKTTIKYFTGLMISGILFSACSQKQEQSLEEMFKDPVKQDEALTIIAENHDLTNKYLNKLMQRDHAKGMMADELIQAAARDTLLARKISEGISKHPDLMLLTMHHFMPVINADEHMCDGFCSHAMEQPNIAENMCHKMKADKEMSCCH